MAITPRVRKQMFRAATSETTSAAHELVRLPPTRPQPLSPDASASPMASQGTGLAWTPAEHDRFLEGLELFPSGPWRRIAEYVGSKNARQTMTHAQKYRQKIARRERGLRVGAPPRKLLAAIDDCGGRTGRRAGKCDAGDGGSRDGSVNRQCVGAGACGDVVQRTPPRERRLLPSPAPSSSTCSSPSSSSPSELRSSAMLLENVVLDALLAEAELLDGAACGSLLSDDGANVGALFDELMRGAESLADEELLAALCDEDDEDDPMSPSPSLSPPPPFEFVCACDPSLGVVAAAAATQELFDMHDRNSFCGHTISLLDEVVLECGDDILCWLSE